MTGRALLLAALACAACSGPGAETADPDAGEDAATFLAAHWGTRPIPPQGPPPDGWPPVTTDLSPTACATCHPAQYADWSGTLHADAFSPGLEGQLAAWYETDPATVASCMTCHGPLSEQLRRVEGPGGEWLENEAYDPELERHGVTCAACHVRGWRRFGPPRRDGRVDPAPPGTPHEGAIRSAAYEDSRFCAPCHQFEEPAPAGKPLENTLREWEASEWADRGVTCQDCHMPDRRHVWRGIHDPETTRDGVTPILTVEGEPDDADFSVRLDVANTGTGHHFPTYVTPAVDLELAFLAGDDTISVRRRTLQRVVEFRGGRWVELRDDRIPAGESRALAWTGPAPERTRRLAARIFVRPDAFYTGLFRDLLASGAPGDPGRERIEEALARTLESPFEMWREERTLESRGR